MSIAITKRTYSLTLAAQKKIITMSGHLVSNVNLMEYASKSSALDVGTIGDSAYDDDYEYICTKTGTAGNAIWKKTPLLNT